MFIPAQAPRGAEDNTNAASPTQPVASSMVVAMAPSGRERESLKGTAKEGAKDSAKDSIKLAVLALVAMLIVATPAVQVWNNYRFELKVLTQLRDTAEPLALAVACQKALLAHKANADALLQGDEAAALRQRAAQALVAERLSKLTSALALRQMDQALSEAQGATQDWLALVAELQRKTLSAQRSAERHQLMMEQLVQVGDLLAESGKLP